MSNMTLNGEPQPWLQDILDTHFPGQYLRSEYVRQVKGHTHIIDFPRSLYCDCDRCRSPFHEHSVIGRTVTITMDTGETYFADLPGDPNAFTHVWKDGKKKTADEEDEDEEEEWTEW